MKISTKIKKIAGFTLVEMLIAMAIFMVFTGVLIGSYSSIVRSQREANEYRIMYVEARKVFETLIQELRDGMVDYEKMSQGVNGDAVVYLISKDGAVKTEVIYKDALDNDGLSEKNTVSLSKSILTFGEQPGSGNYDPSEKFSLNNPGVVKVSKFEIYYSPSIDPYDPKYVNYDKNQFHPRVTIYAEFEKELSNGKKYTMDLQTTVSSRIYSQVYPTEYKYDIYNYSQ